MNKTQAKKIALEETPSWGDLKKLIEKSNLNGVSKVNKSIPRQHLAKIFLELINSKKLDEIPETLSFNIARDRNTINSNGMCIVNILREFH